jgi:hypothetical protein
VNDPCATLGGDRDTPAIDWLTPGRFALILLALLVGACPEVLLLGKNYVHRDFGTFAYPLAFQHRESFWQGEIPLWNPLNNTGVPFLAQWNTLVLYPLSLIYLLLPMPWAVSFFCVAHLFLGGLGMYFLARRWTGSSLGAGVAGVAFAFNGLALNCLMWTNNMAAWGWMPWVVLTVQLAWREGGRHIIFAALVGATQMLAGAPEVILITWSITGLFWLSEALEKNRQLWSHIVRFAVVAGLVAALAAAQLLPFLDLLKHSDRHENYGLGAWAMPAWGWLNLVVPLFRCSPAGSGVFFQPDQWWTSSYYPGVAVLGLGLLAVRLAPARRNWILFTIFLGALLLALGENGSFYRAIKTVVPQIGFIRFPIKFVVAALFALSLLAASGVAALEKPGGGKAVERWLSAVWILLAMAGAVTVWIAFAHPYPKENWTIVWHNAAARGAFLVLSFGLLIGWRRTADPQRRSLCAAMLLLMLFLDVATHAPRQNPVVDGSVFAPGVAAGQLPETARPRHGGTRVFVSLAVTERFYGSRLEDTAKDFLGRRLAFFGNCNLLDGVPKMDGFYSLYIAEQRQIFLRLFYGPPEQNSERLLDFLGVAYTNNPASFLAWEPRSAALPYASVGLEPVFVEEGKMADLIFQKDFDPARMVYLPMEAKGHLSAVNGARARISASTVKAHRNEFTVEADQPALLTVAQTYYPRWQAFIDGKPTRLWRGNFAYQAVEVPAGRHVVELVYVDTAFHIGAAVSSVTLALLAVWAVYLKRRKAAVV